MTLSKLLTCPRCENKKRNNSEFLVAQGHRDPCRPSGSEPSAVGILEPHPLLAKSIKALLKNQHTNAVEIGEDDPSRKQYRVLPQIGNEKQYIPRIDKIL